MGFYGKDYNKVQQFKSSLIGASPNLAVRLLIFCLYMWPLTYWVKTQPVYNFQKIYMLQNNFINFLIASVNSTRKLQL